MPKRYTYEFRSGAHLKSLRKTYHEMGKRREAQFITEILALRREIVYWESLTHVSLGGRRT